MRGTLRERFDAKYEVAESGCWEWRAARFPNGYGYIGAPGGRYAGHLYAHRAAYELFVGPIPAGLVIDHLCRNRSCVNPAHLEPVTHRENSRRGESPTFVASRTDMCLKGHPLIAGNVMVSKANGRRRCYTCNLAWRRARSGWKGHEGPGWNASITHCPKGHPYDGDNLRIEKNGARGCKTCHRLTERARWRAAHPGAPIIAVGEQATLGRPSH